MLKTIKDLLFADIKWKVFSLGLAFVLWFIGMNVNNPVMTKTYQRPLDISNKEALSRDKLYLLNERELQITYINVSVRAPNDDLKSLESQYGSIVPSIDMRAIDPAQVWQSDNPVTVPIDVDVSVLPGYEMMSRWPYNVDVKVDKYVQQSRSIQAYSVGKVMDGYEQQQVKSAHSTVTVSGAKSLVDQVQTVRVQVNVQDANSDVKRVERLIAYDENDVDITGTVELNIKETTVSVSVLPCKRVPLRALVTGTPAADHTILEVKIEPETVELAGPADILGTLNVLSLDGLNMDNASETFTRTFDIRQALPDLSIKLKNGESVEATVTVVIERMVTKEFEYPLDMIRIIGYPSGMAFSLLGEKPAVITVRATESSMNSMDINRMTVQMNLANLEDGTHTVPLTITLPSGFTLVEEAPSVRVLIHSPSEDGTSDSDDDDIDNAGSGEDTDGAGSDAENDNDTGDGNDGQDANSNDDAIIPPNEITEENGLGGTTSGTTNGDSENQPGENGFIGTEPTDGDGG